MIIFDSWNPRCNPLLAGCKHINAQGHLTIPKLNTSLAEEFAVTIAWPGAQANFAGGGAAPLTPWNWAGAGLVCPSGACLFHILMFLSFLLLLKITHLYGFLEQSLRSINKHKK